MSYSGHQYLDIYIFQVDNQYIDTYIVNIWRMTNMNEKNKKTFIIPEADIVDFVSYDIITYSTRTAFPDDWDGEDWEDD